MSLFFIPAETLQRVLQRGTLSHEDYLRLHESGMPITSGLALQFGSDDESGREVAKATAKADSVTAHQVLAALRSPPVQAWLGCHRFNHCPCCGHFFLLASCEHCQEAIQPKLPAKSNPAGSCRLSLGYIHGFDNPWKEFVGQVNACGFPLEFVEGDAFEIPPQGDDGHKVNKRFMVAAHQCGADYWSLDVCEADRTLALRWWRD